MATDLTPLVWDTPTTAAGVLAEQSWRAVLLLMPGGGWNARVLLPSGEYETTAHATQSEAATAAEWALARAGCVQKPVELLLQELLTNTPSA